MTEISSPRRTLDLVGHSEAALLLEGAHASGRLHHAWLLGGVQGIGKTTLAYRFARFVLAGGSDCSAGRPPLHLDPDHPTARRVAAGSHPDLATLERGIGDKGKLRTEIIVEDVREAGEFARKTPAEGGWRVIVVDSADELNASAANALLKLLEEPPPSSLLLLVSHSPGRLLPTIRSRCRRLTLRPLSVEDTVRVIGSNRPEIDPEQQILLARLAEGRPGLALRLAEEGGAAVFDQLLQLLRQLPSCDVPLLHATAEKLARASDKDMFQTFTSLLSWWLGRFVRLTALRAEPWEELVPGERALTERLAEGASLDRWCEVWEKVAGLVARADSLNLDRRQVVLDIFFSLQAAFRPVARASA